MSIFNPHNIKTTQDVKIKETNLPKLLTPSLNLICSNLKNERLAVEEIYLRIQRFLRPMDLSVEDKIAVENIVTNELKDY